MIWPLSGPNSWSRRNRGSDEVAPTWWAAHNKPVSRHLALPGSAVLVTQSSTYSKQAPFSKSDNPLYNSLEQLQHVH